MLSDTQIVPGALTVAVTSGKGGVGKTTTASALAAALTLRGLRVVVIDGDLYGPNVHLVADVADTALVVNTEPLGLSLPTSALGFDVVTPVSITAKDAGARLSMSDLFALAQFAHPPQIVIVDMPPGWTAQHSAVCSLLPDLVVAVVAPTATALADHKRHVAAWQSAWEQSVQARRNQDKRRKVVLAEAVSIVSVETMARFTGIPDGGDQPVTVRRLDALPAAEVAAAVSPLVSVPAAADVAAVALTAEMSLLADVVQAALPA